MPASRSPSPEKFTSTAMSTIKRFEDLRVSQSLDDTFLKMYQDLQKRLELLGRVPRVRVKGWLNKLNELTNNLVWKRNRNRHAWLLLEQIKLGKLGPPFNKVPPEGPLQTLPHWTTYGYSSPTRRRPSVERMNGAQVASSLDEYMYRHDERRRRAAAISPHLRAAQRASYSPRHASPPRSSSPVRVSAGRSSHPLMGSPVRVSAQLQATTLHAQLLEDRLRVAEERIAQQEAELAALKRQHQQRRRSPPREPPTGAVSRHESQRAAWEPARGNKDSRVAWGQDGPKEVSWEQAGQEVGSAEQPGERRGPEDISQEQWIAKDVSGPQDEDWGADSRRSSDSAVVPTPGRLESMKEALHTFERETARLSARLHAFQGTSSSNGSTTSQQLQRNASGSFVQDFERFAADTNRLKAKLGLASDGWAPEPASTFTISGTIRAGRDAEQEQDILLQQQQQALHPSLPPTGPAGDPRGGIPQLVNGVHDRHPSHTAHAGAQPVAGRRDSQAAMHAAAQMVAGRGDSQAPMHAAAQAMAHRRDSQAAMLGASGAPDAAGKLGGVLQQFQHETNQLRRRISAMRASSPNYRGANAGDSGDSSGAGALPGSHHAGAGSTAGQPQAAWPQRDEGTHRGAAAGDSRAPSGTGTLTGSQQPAWPGSQAPSVQLQLRAETGSVQLEPNWGLAKSMGGAPTGRELFRPEGGHHAAGAVVPPRTPALSHVSRLPSHAAESQHPIPARGGQPLQNAADYRLVHSATTARDGGGVPGGGAGENWRPIPARSDPSNIRASIERPHHNAAAALDRYSSITTMAADGQPGVSAADPRSRRPASVSAPGLAIVPRGMSSGALLGSMAGDPGGGAYARAGSAVPHVRRAASAGGAAVRAGQHGSDGIRHVGDVMASLQRSPQRIWDEMKRGLGSQQPLLMGGAR